MLLNKAKLYLTQNSVGILVHGDSLLEERRMLDKYNGLKLTLLHN